MAKHWNETVICLIHIDYSFFLFQLRDKNPEIPFSEHYGAFGGSIEEGESPRVACIRELEEEIGFVPRKLGFFRDYWIVEHDVHVHVFYGSLTIPLSDLCLSEGMDLGLFHKADIYSFKLFSEKFSQFFPVIPNLVGFLKEFCKSLPEK
jgi:8-oxo-dGTP diphosphatase